MGEAIGAIMGSSKAILLGRRTYQEFAPAWSGRTAEEDPGAPFMNESPKYVVSASLQAADWQNTVILGPYRAEAIRDLKDRVDGGIYVSGSGTLVPGRCSPTAWWTSCTCSCSRWCTARASGCSPTPARPSSWPWPGHRPTATGHCT